MKNSKKPETSVIMSVHNGMPFLTDSVKSILNQTYKNFEFIIVDDASTDKTSKYLKSLKDKRIRLLKNSKNLGLAASLNKALKVARGEFIARMDADDISKPSRLETQVKFLINRPSIDICGSWVDLIDEDGKIVGTKKYPKTDKEIKKLLNWQSAIIHPTFFTRDSFFKKLGGYNPDFDLAEDYEILTRAKKDFKMANISKKLLLWRLWEKRRSRQEMQKMSKMDLEIKRLSLRNHGISLPLILAIIKQYLFIYLVPFSLKSALAKSLKLS